MGEVYRAHDTKLNRDVALKILPGDFALDPDRRARFTREAQLLASLNHPNIAAIYGFEDSGDTHALILELVEGETLADRIARGPIPLDETLPIARQICEALEAAHEHGVIHRDLKPANIKVRPDGTVKVLDFGLAKLSESAGNGPQAAGSALSLSPTITSPALMTGVGMLLGTAAYMAPEQARGKVVDKRADIWAFGCALFEMLSGRQAFPGETISDTLVAILSSDVAWSALPPDVPRGIRDLLRRCLQRDAMARLRDAGDARLEIQEAQSPRSDSSPRLDVEVPRRRHSRIVMSALLAVGVLIGVAIGLGGAWVRPPSQTAPPAWKGTLLSGPTVAWVPRISPDGKTLAFLAFVDGLTQVGVMNPESGNWTVLTKDRSRGYVSRISWSRDGGRVYYNRFTDVPLGIYSVPALGGEERLILENANGAEPLADGSLLVAKINGDRQMQIYHYWPGDGRLTALPGILPDTEGVPFRVFPDGTRAVFLGRSSEQSDSDRLTYLYVLDIANGKVSRLATDVSFGSSVGIGANAVAITPDGRSVVVGIPNGDLTKLLAIDLATPSRTTTVLDLPEEINQIDIGPDGSMFLNQQVRSSEIWRFTITGRDLEKLNMFPDLRRSVYGAVNTTLHSPEGRTWISAVVGGRKRLLVTAPGKELVPFVETDEETAGPLTLVDNDRVAFVIGTGDARRIAIASIQDGRILTRIQTVNAATIRAMAISRQTSTLYYVDSGTIWAVPADKDGPPRKIHSGDGVAIAANGQSLIVQLIENQGVRWIRTHLDGSMEETIPVKGDWRFTFAPVGPSAVGRDGRIVLPISVKDSWFWVPAVFNPDTGDVQRIPLPFQADPPAPAWTSDGKIIAATFSLSSSLWRFRPTDAAQK